MKPDMSIGMICAIVLLLMIGATRLVPIPPPDTIQPSSESRGASLEAPAADQEVASDGVQERGVLPERFKSQLGTLEFALQQPPTFTAVSYGGKCLDFGAPPQIVGGPVFLYQCTGSIAQQRSELTTGGSRVRAHR